MTKCYSPVSVGSVVIGGSVGKVTDTIGGGVLLGDGGDTHGGGAPGVCGLPGGEHGGERTGGGLGGGTG